jgi:alkylation response protein AidB-like acyl-CoA dehydrogenase
MAQEQPILPDELLLGMAARAAGYDRENRFFDEDFADLRRAGYLTMSVPCELGGRGVTLAQFCAEQRRLGYYAPATALGINSSSAVGRALRPTCGTWGPPRLNGSFAGHGG